MEERRKIRQWLFSQLVSPSATREELKEKLDEVAFLGWIISLLEQQGKKILTIEELNEQTGETFSENRFFRINGPKKAVSKNGEKYAYYCEECGWVLGHPDQTQFQSKNISETDSYCRYCKKTVGINIIFRLPI